MTLILPYMSYMSDKEEEVKERGLPWMWVETWEVLMRVRLIRERDDWWTREVVRAFEVVVITCNRVHRSLDLCPQTSCHVIGAVWQLQDFWDYRITPVRSNVLTKLYLKIGRSTWSIFVSQCPSLIIVYPTHLYQPFNTNN